MRCKIAETFHCLPHQVEALPFSEYRLLRNYVLAKEAAGRKDDDADEVWGQPDVVAAPWETDVVTSNR